MNKFTKTMLATAVAGLISGPASAIDAAFYVTEGATVKFSGNKCATEKSPKLEMALEFRDASELEGFDGGPNTGIWLSEFLDFGSIVDGEGLVIAAKPGKDLTMDMTGELFLVMMDALEGFVIDNCTNFVGALDPGDTMINRFNTTLSKNGDKATFKFRAQGSYFDFERGVDRQIQLNIDAKLNALID